MKKRLPGALRTRQMKRAKFLSGVLSCVAVVALAMVATTLFAFDCPIGVGLAISPMFGFYRTPEPGDGGGEPVDDEKAMLKRLQNAVDAHILNKGASKDELVALKAELKTLGEKNKPGVDTAEYEVLKGEHVKLMLDFKALQEKPTHPAGVKTLREYIIENSEVLKTLKANLKDNKKGSLQHVSISVDNIKQLGTQGASDIGSRDYFGEIEPGIEKKPVRAPRILDLFKRKPVSTEYLHFWEENVVTRDAKFVIACATSTHLTKKTWQKRTVELAKIRDIVDICIDMLDDLSFIESEVRDLITESITLAADYELLHGLSAAPTDMLSIDSIASEFNASNPLAPYDASFTFTTIGDLISAMAAQIYTFGQERAWAADTVLMNYNDMIKYLHTKDANGNYQFPTFVFGTTDRINGLRIVTSPIVAPNTLYVFDSTKGKILDRKMLTVNSYYENRDNAEHELVTFVGVERLQFHVRNINRDAFMKVSDIAAAIAAITV